MRVPGSRLDRFEILELLGAGGMGEVHRARDSRLGREVALKLLPDQFLRDPQRLARFEREAQVLASLNHPNIAALHEVVALGDSHALVMELVEGETLSERIADGPLPLPEALGIAAQIATALDVAHERGIVHRDLKPGNVKLRPDGTVKLLDFGLAKVADPVAMSDPAAVTLTAVGTAGEAQVLGSPAYMSPEQARGLTVDKRADIWSFGCLLYEMLTGARAFQGERPSDVIARIIEREPDADALPASLPQRVRRLLQRCLEKDPRRRLRDIGDARHELLDVLGNPLDEPTTEASAMRAFTTRPRPLAPLRWVWAAAVVALASLVVWYFGRAEAPAPQVTRFALDARNAVGGGLAISPDGRRIAYLASQGLVVRSRDRLDSVLVARSNLVQGNPFFSPDGEWVGFRGWSAMKRVSVSGGPVSTIGEYHVGTIGTWHGDDIIFADVTGLFRARGGGDPVPLIRAEPGEQIVSVEVLPGARTVLFTVIASRGNVTGLSASLPTARIDALDIDSGRRHTVLRGGGRARYTRTGHLLYVTENKLFAVAFDIDTLRTRGAAVPVIEVEGLLDYDISDEGTLIYQASAPEGHRDLAWVDRQGRATPVGAPPRGYLYPRVSPDGTRAAIDVREDADRDIWMWDFRRNTLERFTREPAGNPLVAWSRDGRELFFGNEESGISNIYHQAADGSGTARRLLTSDLLQMPLSSAPDGRLLISLGVTGQQRDIHVVKRDGSGTEPLIEGPANELWAEVSPDGRWVAYDSDESGQFEVYVRPYPDTEAGGRWQISTGGGRQPVWSPVGGELFYRVFSGAVMAVPVPAGDVFNPGRAEQLFEGTGYVGAGAQGGGRTYDVAPDGKRFLMVQTIDQGESPLVVVLNWFEELQRVAPIR